MLAGHGVAGVEVLEQMQKLGVEPDAIVVPVGGGGLLAGMTTVIQHSKPDMEIIVSCQALYKTAWHKLDLCSVWKSTSWSLVVSISNDVSQNNSASSEFLSVASQLAPALSEKGYLLPIT